MCEQINYDFSDLNLDFLEITPQRGTPEAAQVLNSVLPPSVSKFEQPNASIKIPQNTAEQLPNIRRRKYRIEELAKQIADSDLCVAQIKSLQNEREELLKQLTELQSSADDIRKLYLQENEERKKLQNQSNDLSRKCESLQTEIANKTMFYDQLSSQLEDIANLPIEYNELVQGYLRLFYKYKGDTNLKFPSAISVCANKLRIYCQEKSLKIPDIVKQSPKKRSPKVRTKDSCIQCELWKTAPESALPHPAASEPKKTRSQGTQYISTTTTRSTCTSDMTMKRTVGTCFPEQQDLPPFNEIMKELRQWVITPVSPLRDDPPEISVAPSEAVNTFKKVDIGTCTIICNVQRGVDYIGSGNHLLTSIKRSTSRPPSRTMLESIKHEMMTPPPFAPPLNFPYSGTVPNTATSFEDLWHVFGQMLFSVLNSRRGHCVNAAERSLESTACSQQEFYQWLMSMYGNGSELPEQHISSGTTVPNPLLQTGFNEGTENNPVEGSNIETNPMRTLNPSTVSEISAKDTKCTGVLQENCRVPIPAPPVLSNAPLCTSETNDKTQKSDRNRLATESRSEISDFNIPQQAPSESFNKLSTKTPKIRHPAKESIEPQNLSCTMENSKIRNKKIKKCSKKKKKRKVKKIKSRRIANIQDEPEKLIPENEELNANKYEIEERFPGNLAEHPIITANEETQTSSIEKIELVPDNYNFCSFELIQNKEEKQLEETENIEVKVNSYRVKTKVEDEKVDMSAPSIELCENAVQFIMQLGNFRGDWAKYNNSTACASKISDINKHHTNRSHCNNSFEYVDFQNSNHLRTESIDEHIKSSKDENTNLQILTPQPNTSKEFIPCDPQLTNFPRQATDEVYQNVLQKYEQSEKNNLLQFQLPRDVEEKEPFELLAETKSELLPDKSVHIIDSHQLVNGIPFLINNNFIPKVCSRNNSAEKVERLDSTLVQQPTPVADISNEPTIEEDSSLVCSPFHQESWNDKEIQCSDVLYQVPLEEITEQSSAELYPQCWNGDEVPESIGEIIVYSSSYGDTTAIIEREENNTQLNKNEDASVTMNFWQTEDKQKVEKYTKPFEIEDLNGNIDIVDDVEEIEDDSKESTLIIDESDTNAKDVGSLKSCLPVPNVFNEEEVKDERESKICVAPEQIPDLKVDRTDVEINDALMIPEIKLIPCSKMSNTSVSEEIIKNEDNPIADEHDKFHNYLCHILQDVAPRNVSPISVITSLSPTSSVKSQPKKRGRKRKSEISPSLSRKSPTPDVACKRSERLRVKRRLAETTIESYSDTVLPLNMLGKYTTKRKCNESQSVLKTAVKFKMEKEVAASNADVKDTPSIATNIGFFRERDFEEIDGKLTDNVEEAENVITTASVSKLKNTPSLSIYSRESSQHTSLIKKENCVVNPQPQFQAQGIKEDDNLATQTNFKKTYIDDNTEKSNCDMFNEVQTKGSFPPVTKTDSSNVNQNLMKIPPEIITAAHEIKRISIFKHLIANYKRNIFSFIRKSHSKKDSATSTMYTKLRQVIMQFIVKTNEATEQIEYSALQLVNELYSITDNLSLITEAMIAVIQQVPRPEVELMCELADVPQKYLGKQHRRLSYVMRRLQAMQPQFVGDFIGQLESTLFNYDTSEKLSLPAILNVTQLYLLTISIDLPLLQMNPSRLFIAKCLYYYKLKATPMIYEVLCCFPTAIPHREEQDYDHSDALITVIKHLLMSTKYDMDSKDLRTKELLSKLRFEYHFEPFKPQFSEVLANLVDKLKAGQLENVPYAMALLCKRMPQPKVEADILQEKLLPLLYEYYPEVAESDSHDDTIAGLLECISMVIKPFCSETDIDLYLSIFGRFLNATDRSRIQEAAVQAILRCRRFGYDNCFYALVDFKPSYDLQPQTKAMLKSFIYCKSARYLRNLLTLSAF